MAHPHNVNPSGFADVIFVNGRIATQDERDSSASALAIRGDRFAAVGDERSIAALRGPATRVIDAGGRTVIPGLNDSHIHVIRGGLNYHLELRWDGVPSLADALRMLREQARQTAGGATGRNSSAVAKRSWRSWRESGPGNLT